MWKRNRPNSPICAGVARTVARRKSKMSLARERMIVCPECGRTVAINYDGRIRYHVAKLRR